MKILNLVLYSDNDEIYVQMYQALSGYYKGFSDVSTYFYKYNENISGNIEITGDIINIKGRESYMPGILNNTIDAFMLFKNPIAYSAGTFRKVYVPIPRPFGPQILLNV